MLFELSLRQQLLQQGMMAELWKQLRKHYEMREVEELW